MGKGRFKGFSAGSKPGGREDLRSKSWDEFSLQNASKMNFIITVCDNAAGETCPYWPGHPTTAQWGYEDPAALEGSDEEKRALFAKVFRQIMNRMEVFVGLPLHTLDEQTIKLKIKAIGETPVSLA